MTAIVVCSNDGELGRLVARRTAAALEYDLLGPELLDEVAREHGVPRARLDRALEPTSRLADRTRSLLLAQIRAVTLERLQRDRQVCHGLAAHLYVRDVSHVLTVRILQGTAALVEQIAADQGLSEARATRQLQRSQERRSRWAAAFFGVDEADAANYDMVLALGQIEVVKAVQIIKGMAGYRKFRPMTYSRKCLADLALAARVRVALLPSYPELRVQADGDKVAVLVRGPRRRKQRIAAEIKEVAGKLPQVSLVEVHTVSSAKELQQREGMLSLDS